ncbi:MAG TPA: PAS domain-containing sensor histidine kinase [Bacteroidales bacterium]|nr:PAS domain-containing sensor histidine kinase [Bacteroidales bacterium]
MIELFENTKINYQVLDKDFNIRYVNKPWLNTLGYKADEATGKPFISFVSDSSLNHFRDIKKDLMKGKCSDDSELTLMCCEGEEINVCLSCFLKFDTEGEIDEIHAVFQNITKLKKTEEALKKSEDKYERIFNSISDVYYQTDLTNIITLVSPSVRKLGYYNPGEITGRSVNEFFVDPTDRQNFRELLYSQGFVYDYDLKLKDKNGNILNVSANAEFIKDNNGEVTGVEGLLRDITERLKLQSDLAQSHRRLTEITDSLPVILFQLEKSGRGIILKYISPNVDEIIGIKSSTTSSSLKHILKLLSPSDIKQIKHDLLLSINQNREVSDEYQVLLKGKTQRWFRIKVSPRVINEKESTLYGISWDVTEEVNMKNQLHEQAERLKELYDFTNVGIASMSVTGMITSVSQPICDVTGYAVEDLVGKHFTKTPIFPKKDHGFYLKLFASALKGILPGEKLVFEWIHKTGETRWGDAYLSIIREKGKIKGFQGIFTESTNRILREKAEKSQQESIALLFSSAVRFLEVSSEKEFFEVLAEYLHKLVPHAIININSINDELTQLRVESVTGLKGNLQKSVYSLLGNKITGRIVPLNKDSFSFAQYGKLIKVHENLYDMTFHTVPETVCRQIEKLVGIKEILEISIGTGNHILGSCVLFVRDGHKIDNAGLIETFFKQATLTLVRLRINDKLTRKELLYRSLAENTGDMILRLDRDMLPIYANPAFLELFNLEENFLVKPGNWNIGMSKQNSGVISSSVMQAFRSGKQQNCAVLLEKLHTSISLDLGIYPEKDEAGEVSSVLIYARDITDRKKLESKIQDSIELKNRMYSFIGHDLKSPLGGIIGMLELLNSDMLDNESERRKCLENAYEASQKLDNLLNTLLEWGHEFLNAGDIKPVLFDVSTMLNKALDLFRIQILEKDLLVRNYIPDNVMVKADYNMLFASFRNLISNACKFSYRGGVIEINCIDNSDNVLVIIKDYGVGMSKDELEGLMSNSLRFSRPGTMQEPGNGLGFSFSRELIELNNGKIFIDSIPGKGTTVTTVFKK